MTTIALRPGSDARLGGTVFFDVTGIPKSVQNPRVQVLALDENANVIYGETGSLAQAVGDGTDPLGYSGFLLGGGGSVWKDRGGPAHCMANLYHLPKVKGQQTFVVLATCQFEAAGPDAAALQSKVDAVKAALA